MTLHRDKKSAQLHQAITEVEQFVFEQYREVLSKLEELRVLVDHGTRGHYATGCRHPACVEANRVYDLERRKAKRENRIARINAEYDELENKLDRSQDS